MAAQERERGFLLIADMEDSTGSKFVLDEAAAYEALVRHNRIVMDCCRDTRPIAGRTLNSLGDAVVVKFPDGGDVRAALECCLAAAASVVRAFEALPPVEGPAGRTFRVRTKLLLQRYDAFRYGLGDPQAPFPEELVGPDIDLAFRLAPTAWRLQVLVTEGFVAALLAHAEPLGDAATDAPTLLARAHLARHVGAQLAGPLEGVSEAYRLGEARYWFTDAREMTRLKGIRRGASVFALAFEPPTALIARGEAQRLTIKVRQDHHAVILVSISLDDERNDRFIDHVVDTLRDASDGNRLDSEVTLCAAAKIFGEYDFFFRVSCIDDESLRRFFNAIQDESFGVSHLEVRSTVTDRFVATRHYGEIFERFRDKPYEIVLAWFERYPDRDVFEELKAVVTAERREPPAVEILEVGEVIHRTPVYAVFACERIADYAAFFSEHRLRPTTCRSYVGHVDGPADAQLRYSLLGGVYFRAA